MAFWRFIRELIDGDQPKQSPAHPAEPQVSEADRCRDEINRLVAEFLAEGHAPVVELANQRSGEIGYHGITTTSAFYLTGNGWAYNDNFASCGFALTTTGVWSYVGYYGVRDHHHVDKVEAWEGTPNRWLEIDEREFRYYTDKGTASPQHALEAAQEALAQWRQARQTPEEKS